VRVGEEEAARRPQAAAGQGVLDQRLLVAADAVDAEPLSDRLVHRLARVERAGRVLEDELDLPPVGLQRAGALADRPAAVPHLTGGRPDQAEDRPRRGGLAAAGLAGERHDLARPHRQVHPVHRPGHRPPATPRPEVHVQLVHVQVAHL
jgi:hypothetical protein